MHLENYTHAHAYTPHTHTPHERDHRQKWRHCKAIGHSHSVTRNFHRRPRRWRRGPIPLPAFPDISAHPVLVWIVSLHAGPLEAELSLTTAGAICPGEVAGLAHHLPLGLASAPQLCTVLHVRAGFRAHPKGQLALLAQTVACARQVLRQGDGLAGLVQEAVTCIDPRTFIRTSWRK